MDFSEGKIFAPLGNRATHIALFCLIVLGVLFRIYDLGGPVLDHHYMRQVDTAALARNFAEEGMNIFYPRVDWRGASPGYVESEFQLYTYLIAILYRLFGEHVELARGLNLVFYGLTALVFFKFTRRLYNPVIALLATFFYAVMPLTAFFGRSVQPDAMMLLGSISALYFFMRWCDEGKWSDLAISALGLSIALLVKPLNLYLAAPLLFLCAQRFGWKLFLKPQLWLYGAAVLLPALIWYQHAYSLWVEYGNTLYRGYSKIDFSWLRAKEFPYPILSLKYDSIASSLVWRAVYLLATPGGLLFMVVGAMAIVRERNHLLLSWVAAFGLTMVVFTYQHRAHDYYQLPMAFVAAIAMAVGLVRIVESGRSPRVTALILLVCYVLTGVVWFWWMNFQWFDNNYRNGTVPLSWIALFIAGALLLAAYALVHTPNKLLIFASMGLCVVYGAWQTAQFTTIVTKNLPRMVFSARLQALTKPTDRVVIAHNNHRPNWFQHRTAQGEILSYLPVEFYLSRRKGWSVEGAQVPPAFLETLRQRGATHFASANTPAPSVMQDYPALKAYLECAYTPLDVQDRWVIYRLDPPRTRPDGSSCLTPSPSAAPGA